jgi:hypothetical protein
MRYRSTLFALAFLMLFGLGAGGAHAQKGVPAAFSVLFGGRGVVAPDGKVRYVALTTGRQTIVSFVHLPSGQVRRWSRVPGVFGIPMVGLDGTTDGIAHDGHILVLATPPGRATTEFAAVDTRTLRARRVTLRGTWSYDAISPDGSLLYLIQYTEAGPTVSYQVRAYDLEARRLFARPIVDTEIGERLMRGWAVTRKTTSNGRWAYTLYARAKNEPFVHALDTVRRQAYCIDLPLDLKRPDQMTLRLALRSGRMLDVRQGRTSVAVVDTRTFVVHEH